MIVVATLWIYNAIRKEGRKEGQIMVGLQLVVMTLHDDLQLGPV